jgi:hypothetical protein
MCLKNQASMCKFAILGYNQNNRSGQVESCNFVSAQTSHLEETHSVMYTIFDLFSLA